MLRKKILILTILLSCISIQFAVFAQRSTAKATVQPYEIAIGQQATISLEVIAPKGRQLVFPAYVDSLVSGVEVLAMPKPDTVYAHEVMTITQKYIVTSFDSALYHIPYLPVLDGKDTIQSNGFGLKVISPVLSEATLNYLEQLNTQQTDSIEFDKLGVFDIKNIQTPPFVWQDYIYYILIGLLILLILAAIGVGVYMYIQKKKKGYYFKPVVVEPPHVIALHALDHVKVEKLWQQGKEKEYFTEVTDILRKYIEDRFGVSAFEMTSDEILNVVKNFMIAESSTESLHQVLKLSDLVKFAKYKPFPDENDLSLVNAYLFVNQTKKEEVLEPVNPNQLNERDDSEKGDSDNWKISGDKDGNENRTTNANS
ncbi:hypothetical protein G7050_02190 [Dysgonomonas sp. HDW5A]|uniref:hypothetical protein n=1 Tax=Dysgonomonas sp. HDW5A TaxID=2714926 RepID=UPI001407F362|nr:hypothetical protein [Dysgonomonas sp. HDW5A]QIK58713.1 hypothetical protein G7050_02190 [Dysgonomonas sp. HDW5A]